MHTLHIRGTLSATGIDAQRRAFLPNMRRQSAEVRAAHTCMFALYVLSPARPPPGRNSPPARLAGRLRSCRIFTGRDPPIEHS